MRRLVDFSPNAVQAHSSLAPGEAHLPGLSDQIGELPASVCLMRNRSSIFRCFLHSHTAGRAKGSQKYSF